jgi:hypothetical protein
MANLPDTVTIEDVKQFLSRILQGDEDFAVSPELVDFMANMRAEWIDLRQYVREATMGTHQLITNVPPHEFIDVERAATAVPRFKVMPRKGTFAGRKATRWVAVMPDGHILVESDGSSGELRRGRV